MYTLINCAQLRLGRDYLRSLGLCTPRAFVSTIIVRCKLSHSFVKKIEKKKKQEKTTLINDPLLDKEMM